MNIRWCVTHDSLVFRPVDDPDDYWLCESSNMSGDRTPCEVMEATVTIK